MLAVVAPDLPVLTITDAEAEEGEDIVFTASIQEPVGKPLITIASTSIQSSDTAEATDFTALNQAAYTILAGETSAEFIVGTSDDSGNPLYEQDETFTLSVELRDPDLTTPISETTAKGTILNNEPLPMVSFQTASRAYREDSGTLASAITMDVETVNEQGFTIRLHLSGDATAGDDYLQLARNVTVSPSQSSKSVPLTIIDDNVFEDSERIVIRASIMSGDAQVDPSAETATVIIDDNDPAPVLSVKNYTGTEGGQNQGVSPVTGQDFANVVFCLELTGSFEPEITVQLTVTDGTAVMDEDYRWDYPVALFSPDITRNCLTAEVIDDDDFEGGGTEYFTLRMFNSSHEVIVTEDQEIFVQGNIRDNEAPPPGVDYVPADISTDEFIAAGDSWANGRTVQGRIEYHYDEDWYRTHLTGIIATRSRSGVRATRNGTIRTPAASTCAIPSCTAYTVPTAYTFRAPTTTTVAPATAPSTRSGSTRRPTTTSPRATEPTAAADSTSRSSTSAPSPRRAPKSIPTTGPTCQASTTGCSRAPPAGPQFLYAFV